jgi:hypothetical protein
LLLTDLGVSAGAFGFDQGEGFAVVAPEDVIDKAAARGAGHSSDGEFAFDATGLGAECPAGFFEQEVDEVIAGLGFGVVVGVGLGLGGGFGDRYFLAELFEFGFDGAESAGAVN